MNEGQINLLEEIIVDNFAGGGGASTGMELAAGRPVAIAINHDPAAILIHKTNHPYTEHLQASVWDVDPVEVCRGRPVGLAWFSPDCKHFSKAKGGKPVNKEIRGLAWITLRWAGTVRPRVIILENVEEFQTWGPVRLGKPVKSKKGHTFQKFVSQLESLGYAVEFRELVAADYGAPTIRKRFFLVARCDGKPIVWPEPTHSKTGEHGLPKWRSAAEIIDWSLPCPSIFDSKQEILEKHGLKAVRPLADNTMRRVIRGVDKFTLKSGTPFLVPTGYGERSGQAPRVHGIGAPVPTVVSKAKQNLCEPYLVQVNHSGSGFRGQMLEGPMPTITGKHGYGVAEPMITPYTVTNTSNSVGHPANEPIDTARTGGGQMMVASSLIQYHTEQSEAVRGQGLRNPIQTVDASNRYGLSSAHLTQYFSNANPICLTDPLHTVTTRDREGLTLAHIAEFKGQDKEQEALAPLRTITAGGGKFGTARTTICRYLPERDMGHWPKVRDLLNKYCGYAIKENEVILLTICGVQYYIADIGLRMLTPRELYRAMGFPDDYIIDRDYTGNEYNKSAQVARCGNAVCPALAEALVRANLPEMCGQKINTMAELERLCAV